MLCCGDIFLHPFSTHCCQNHLVPTVFYSSHVLVLSAIIKQKLVCKKLVHWMNVDKVCYSLPPISSLREFIGIYYLLEGLCIG